MMNNDRGRGASGPKKPAPVKDRICVSPMYAPTPLTPSAKKMFADTEKYHDGKGSKKDY